MKKILFRFIGVAIFTYLLFGVVGANEFLNALRGMSPLMLLLVIPFHLIQWTLRIIRWQILLKDQGICLPFMETYAVAATGFFLGSLTPGRVGEFSKVKFLMNAGYPFRESFISSFIERLLDVAALAVFVLAGVVVCYSLLPAESFWYLLISALLLLGLAALVVFRDSIKRILIGKIPERVAAGMEGKLQYFTESLQRITLPQWGIMSIYSLLIWGLNYWMIYLLFLGIGQSIPLVYALAFGSFASLAGLVPFAPYGSGVREAMMIPLFALLPNMEEPEKAGLLFGIMFLVLLVYHIALGFFFWMSPWMSRFLNKEDRPQPLP